MALQPNGEGAKQGSLQDLRAQNVLPDSVEDPVQDNTSADERSVQDSNNASQLGDNKQREHESISEPIMSDKNVLAFYMKSMGFWNGMLFLVFGILCTGLWKASGMDHAALNFLPTDLLQITGLMCGLNTTSSTQSLRETRFTLAYMRCSIY